MRFSGKELIVAGFILVMALLYRLWASDHAFSLDFDTGTVALMVQHILDGQRPLFFYGQNYMGALEAYVAAGFCKLFGYSHFNLSLAPISFSLCWVGFTALLFNRWLGKRAGLIALLILAFPGWYFLRYSVGTFGGYQTTLAFGVMSLYFAERWLDSELIRPQIAWSLLLGLVAGLGLWTHFLVLPFLATAGLMILIQLFRGRFTGWSSLLPGGILAVVGLYPYAHIRGTFVGTKTTDLHWDTDHWFESIQTLGITNWPMLTGWGHNNHVFLTWATFVAMGLSVIALIFGLMHLRKWPLRMRWSVGLFSLLFLFMFLPHSMSTLKAPRYLLSIYGLLSVALWASALCFGSLKFRAGIGGVFIAWLSLQIGSGIHYVKLEAPRVQDTNVGSQAFIQNAKASGAEAIGLLGGLKFRLEGQRFSADADEDPIFFNVEDERYLPYAHRFDSAKNYGYAVRSHHGSRLKDSMNALNCAWETFQGPSVNLAANFKPESIYPEAAWQWVPDLKIDGHDALSDARISTGLEWNAPFSLVLDAGGIVSLDRLWLTEPHFDKDRLPSSYTIEVSNDGLTYRRLAQVRDRLPDAEIMGARLVVGHRYARFEHRFRGEMARYVRLVFDQLPLDGLAFAEVTLFERIAPWALPEGSTLMRTFLREQAVEKVYADLWISAQLKNAGFDVLPRYNPKFTATAGARKVGGGQGEGLAVERALAEQVEGVLRDEQWVFKRLDVGAYSLFSFSGETPAETLFWSGRNLLKQ